MVWVLTAAAVDRLRHDGFHFPIPCIEETRVSREGVAAAC